MSEHDAPTLGPSTPTAQRARLTGWGLGPKTEAWVTSSADHDEVLAAVLRDPGDWSISVAKAGAIASDVHGKNHVRAGSFARHVTSLGLLLSSGEVDQLRPGNEDGWFGATVGGWV